MPKLPVLKSREVERALLRAHFVFIRQKGSHRIYHKAPYAVTVPWHNHDLRTGTLKAVIRQAGLSVQGFIQLL